jgi:hypothetical protein
VVFCFSSGTRRSIISLVIENEDELEPTGFKRFLRDLPRKRTLLIAVIVLVNMGLMTYWRGCRIRHERITARWGPVPIIVGSPKVVVERERELSEDEKWPMPWSWTTDEWRETVWPWK